MSSSQLTSHRKPRVQLLAWPNKTQLGKWSASWLLPKFTVCSLLMMPPATSPRLLFRLLMCWPSSCTMVLRHNHRTSNIGVMFWLFYSFACCGFFLLCLSVCLCVFVCVFVCLCVCLFVWYHSCACLSFRVVLLFTEWRLSKIKTQTNTHRQTDKQRRKKPQQAKE